MPEIAVDGDAILLHHGKMVGTHAGQVVQDREPIRKVGQCGVGWSVYALVEWHGPVIAEGVVRRGTAVTRSRLPEEVISAGRAARGDCIRVDEARVVTPTPESIDRVESLLDRK
jgi:hypothetical protein